MARKAKEETTGIESPIINDIDLEKKVSDEGLDTDTSGTGEDEDDKESEKEAPVVATVGSKKETLVKIRCSEDIEATIAKVSYKFSKKTTQVVPAGVAAILCNSGKAFRA